MHFSWAMDLDPKGANSQIKDALDPALNRASQEEISVLEAGMGDVEVRGVDADEEVEEVEEIGEEEISESRGGNRARCKGLLTIIHCKLLKF